jgi:hypothetical protein
VVCDDTTTAVGYFELLAQKHKDRKRVRVLSAPRCGATGADTIEFAIAQKRDPVETGDVTAALIDLDTNPNRQALLKRGVDEGVEVLFSNPCFEVWTLAHLEDTGAMFVDCNAVLSRVKTRWKAEFGQAFDRKAKADYSKIIGHCQTAVERCSRRDAGTSQSWTEVWRIVKAIIAD